MSTAPDTFGSDTARRPTWVCSRWAIATILGAFSAIVPFFLTAASFPDVGERYEFVKASIFVTFLAVSIGQWIILRSFLAGMWKWVPVTTLFGFAAAEFVALGIVFGPDVSHYRRAGIWSVVTDMVPESLFFALVHTLVLGVPQWLVLRKKVSRSGWWLLATAVGSVLTAPSMMATVILDFDSHMEFLFVTYAAIIIAWTAMAISQGYTLGRLVKEKRSS